jgi:hypothetical protein
MCNPRLCEVEIMSQYSFMFDTCVESMAVIVYGKNKRCGGETIYTLWCSCPSNLEKW